MVARSQRAGRLPPDERRAAIVAASLPLVLQFGIDVSTRQIAEAADVAEGTIFRVFPDKEALMHAVLAEALDPEPTLRELAEVDRALPLRARLTAGVRIMQGRLAGVFGLLDALRSWESAAAEHHRGMHGRPAPRTMNDAIQAALADLVGPDGDELRVSATHLAHVMRVLVFSATHPRITDGRPLPAEEIVGILLDGLLARPDSHHHAIEGRSC